MYNDYKFYIDGTEFHPQFKEAFIETARDSGQRYFRTKFNGKLTFVNSEYDYIDQCSFGHSFSLLVYRYTTSLQLYSTCKFHKTDCTFDTDNRIVEVSPIMVDNYENVIAGLEKEFNLIKLSPAITPIKVDKRPLLQVYVEGSDVLTNFLGGTYWEQEVTEPQTGGALISTYKFANTASPEEVIITGTFTPNISGIYAGTNNTLYSSNRLYRIENTGGYFQVIRQSDNEVLFQTTETASGWVGTLYLEPYGGGATGSGEGLGKQYLVYMRYLLNNDTFEGTATYDVPLEDIVAKNYNYTKVKEYSVTNAIVSSSRYSVTPTEYGLMSEGKYFLPPYIIGNSTRFYPIGRSEWLNTSIWFNFDQFDHYVEARARTPITIKDNYPIYSVIKVLLNEIAPEIAHEGTSEYSEFLYGSTSITFGLRYFITPKTNVKSSYYSTPAQKAEIKLKDVFDMLKNVFQCYWYIEDSKLKIEHISFFKSGGSYTNPALIGTDLTSLTQPRNMKAWDYGQGKFEYDKIQMPEKYQFSWMDSVSEAFEGFPIEINSNYITRGLIEEVSLSQFTTDIDFVLSNTDSVSDDGFIIMGALDNEGYYLPYYNTYMPIGDLYLQNGFLSWVYLHKTFYVYDLPSTDVDINGEKYEGGVSISRDKVQKVRFPSNVDIDPLQLVKTSLGNGEVENMSVNLDTRINEVTLRYDTE
jgi:hypothetical protein